MSNPKTQIAGTVRNIEEKPGSKNPWYILDIEATLTDWQQNNEQVTFQIKAFGRVSEKVKVLRNGDFVTCKCAVRSNEWKGKYYTELSLEAIESHSNVVPPETVAQDIQDEASKQMDGDQALPF
jgi:hypothetical protein